MLKKRIIPCLDIKDGRTVKGINFVELKDCGDPIELAKYYCEQGCDELVFLDITATINNRKTLMKLVENIAKVIDIPFTVGGGIKSMGDVSDLLSAGADKVSINSAAIDNPKLIFELSDKFGSQCIVVAIDTKHVDNRWLVYKNAGRIPTLLSAVNWARQVSSLGAGEILLTVMDNDGTKSGYALSILSEIDKVVNIPVIASGGAGCVQDFKELFLKTEISAGLAASVFHFGEILIPDLKSELFKSNIAIRI